MKKLFCIVFVAMLATVSFAQPPAAIQQYLNIRSASAPAFSPDGKYIAYLTNVSGTTQVWTIALPNGTPRQLTKYDDNVGFVRWLGDGTGLIFGKAKGGDENTQFFWMKPDGSGVRALTDEPSVRHDFGAVSWDSRTIYYASNKRSRNFFDIYSMDLATGKEEIVYSQDGNNEVAAINDSGSKLIVSRSGTEFSLDNDLYIVDMRTKAESRLTPHMDASEYSNVHFVADGIVFAQNDGREFINLTQLRKVNAAIDNWSPDNIEATVVDRRDYDVTGIEMPPYGNVMAYTINRDGYSELDLRPYETGGKPLITTLDSRVTIVGLPAQGIVSGMAFNHDQSKLAFTFNSARNNGDIWMYDLKTERLTQITHSDTAGIPTSSFVSPELIKYKTFDGREIPAWYYRPRINVETHNGRLPVFKGTMAPDKNLRVIVSVHGGPEGQERPGFNALYQYYLSRGYAIIAPNVRGSTGYGKTFTHLDDVRKREDTLKDLIHITKWLRESGGADPKRIAIMGGSYGGYMTLAAITLYPDAWAAAVDTVGIANWESFMKNTSGYRRRQREVEYGSLEKDGDFLRSISPINKVDKIKTPLFVIAGRNDPRVPYTEAEQIVGALRKRNATVEYKLFDDEGHGVSKLKNRLVLYPLVADFLDKYMKK